MSEDIDERLRQDTEGRKSQSRSEKEPGTGRRPREEGDRAITESRELSEDERLEMFRQQLFNDALPDLPKIPGYHTCWLTTTNPRDPVHRRMMLGYEPVMAADIPGFEYASLKTGEWAGVIGVNEMVAFKLPQTLYEAFMHEAHHAAPAREQEKLASMTDLIREQAERKGLEVVEGDGTADMRRGVPASGVFED